MSLWQGMLAPGGTDKQIVQRLNREIAEILRQKDAIDRFLASGTVPSPSTPEEFTALIRSQIELVTRIARTAKFQPID